MEELPPFGSEEREKEIKRIKSPSQMAKSLGFIQDPKTAHSHDREYSKDFQEEGALPAVKTLYSGDFLQGQYEEVSVGVRLREPRQIWFEKHPVVSDAFLNWFEENGGDSKLAEKVKGLKPPIEKQQLEERQQKDRVKKDKMKKEGYSLMARIIEQTEELGYFEYLREKLSSEFKRKKDIAEEGVKQFLAEFPQYSLFKDSFDEEGIFYIAEKKIEGGKVPAMEISIDANLDAENTGKIGFRLGSMEIDEEGTLSSFYFKGFSKLLSGEYPQTWFEGEMSTIIGQAIEARKEIQAK